MVNIMKYICVVLILWLSACATQYKSVYQQMGGHTKIELIVEYFITEIEYDETMFNFFQDSNIDRFREKLTEHLCILTGGPCEYTGDTMEQVHAGMNITESDFNHSVDLFIQAMNKAKIPHTIQNKILGKIAPIRKSMIYL